MKFSLSCLSLSLGLLLCHKPSEAAETSIRGGEKKVGVITNGNEDKGEVQRGTRFLSERRRLLPMEGVFRTLIIRVTDSEGNEPITDARKESDVWFGTHGLELAGNQNSLDSLYDQCSGGKINFVPATGDNVTDGVLEFTIDQDLNGKSIGDVGSLVRSKFNQLNADLGIVFDAYSIICPKGVRGSGGLAAKGGTHQYYAGGADRSLELVMHEFGHNFGFHHSGVPGEGDYDDNSCMMGCCAGAQQMCFNAAKSWYTGWYTEPGKDGHENLNDMRTPGQWWKGNLVGIDDYLNGVFDENEHRVVVRTPALYFMFNRAKGVNAGVKAYRNQVVVIQQWNKGGKSKVLAKLDEESSSFQYSSEHYTFDIFIKVCEITYPPTITGPQILGGNATQSTTSNNAEAHRAVDGNLDTAWTGNSVTHTAGDEMDPWWKLVLDTEEEVEHIRVYNRGDCCGSRLNNAFIELFDGEGVMVFSRNMGAAEDVKEVFLNGVYNVKEVLIRLQGDKILSLAEVQLFAPSSDPQARKPDYAEVIVYIADRSAPIHYDCASTIAPTQSSSPSANPTVSFQPTHYVAIPRDVLLKRDDSPCVSQKHESHPDRFKCMIEPTSSSSEPGGYWNEEVVLRGENGCVIIVRPVTWSWAGNAFVFQSTEDLDTINECFAPGKQIVELRTTIAPSIAPSKNDITGNPTTSSPTKSASETPSIGSTGNPTDSPTPSPTPSPTTIPTPSPTPSPTTSPTPSPTTSPTGEPTALPTAVRSEEPTESTSWVPSTSPHQCHSHSDCDDFDECTTNVCRLNTCQSIPGACSETGQVCLEKRCVPPVELQRDDSLCILQHNPTNHPDRFKCMIETTSINKEPGGFANDDVVLRGKDGCHLVIQPMTWAWAGNAFIFQSNEDLDTINDCFAPGTLIVESEQCNFDSDCDDFDECTTNVCVSNKCQFVPDACSETGQNCVEKRCVPPVELQRDDSPCVFQRNRSTHPDRFKCMIETTSTSNEPGGHWNDGVALRGKDGCHLVTHPVTWAWEGNAFIFQSTEDLDTINECLAPGTLIVESEPSQCNFDSDCDDFDECTTNVCRLNTCQSIPGACSETGQVCLEKRCVPPVELQRDDSLCILQHNPTNHPDRFKCMIETTSINKEPGGFANDDVVLRGKDGCHLVIQPMTWAWAGNAFIFQSNEDLDTINDCFAPGTLIVESEQCNFDSDCDDFDECTTNVCVSNKCQFVPDACSETGQNCVEKRCVPPVELQRDDSPCVFQRNRSTHPDRFKCMIETTSTSNEPGGHWNDGVALRGKDGCHLVIHPVTWAWEGNAFIFQSTEDLDTINECLAPGTNITEINDHK